MNIVTLVLWATLGLLVLARNEPVNKFDYACCWLVLMIQLIRKLL